jgi:catechol 2,3-dioxygenase-like lactoylglutathione lyase family enzyme
MEPIMKKSLILALVVLASLWAPRVDAQLAAPNASGAAMGHLHLRTKDVEASRKFWTTLGGVPVQNGALQLIQFPGVFVMLTAAEPSGGTAGSVVDRIGFRVKNIKESMQKWQESSIKIESGGIINAPDGVVIELLDDASIATPIRMDRISLRTAAPSETQAWYVKTFGAAPGKHQLPRAASSAPVVQVDAATLPGVTLTFNKSDAAPLPTRGRALDHIGFEIKGLEAFCKKLESDGVKFDRPYRTLPNSTVAIAFLTDPWGTYIELTENLAPAK